VTTLDRTGIISGVLATKNETAGEALTVLKAEITRMRDSGITTQELADAKSYLTGAWPLAFDSNSSITSRLLAFRLDGLSPDYGDKRNAEILALTGEQMKRVAKTYLDPNRMLTVVLGKPVGIAAK
jgi:zinc protease